MEYTNNILDSVSSLHFTGIGGIGMSALAEILHYDGYKISGSDTGISKITEHLEELGITFNQGNCPEFVKDCDLLVYTAAVKPDNPELIAAKEKGIPAIERSELLGCVQRKFTESVAVAGTHGKTTVTSMISCVLIAAGIDPTVCAGGIIPAIGSNARVSNGDCFVCEACEYVDSFLKLSPKYAVITNVEHDHIDYFESIQEVINSFAEFMSQSEYVILNGDDKNALEAISKTGKRPVTFGFAKGDYHAENITFDGGYPSFDVIEKGALLGRVKLSVPGNFNIMNALAAIAVSRLLGADISSIISGLYDFKGASRRFEYVGTCNGAPVYDDYGHHPDEIRETLTAASMFPNSRCICVFQPHTYTRTEAFKEDMAKSLSLANLVILAPIYAARETNETGISSADIAQLIDDSLYLQSFEEISDFLKSEVRSDDFIIVMGAGNINQLSKMIVDRK